jgi:hypothetical protein
VSSRFVVELGGGTSTGTSAVGIAVVFSGSSLGRLAGGVCCFKFVVLAPAFPFPLGTCCPAFT